MGQKRTRSPSFLVFHSRGYTGPATLGGQGAWPPTFLHSKKKKGKQRKTRKTFKAECSVAPAL